MRDWRPVLLLGLLVFPFLLFAAIGAVALFETHRLLWLMLVFPVAWGTAYALSRRWRTDMLPLPSPKREASMHWTDRDEAAWKLVETRVVTRVANLEIARLTEVKIYYETALEMALEIARSYHPTAADPFGRLTIVEILAAAQLALDDLAELMQRSAPGSHLLTVDAWRTLHKAPQWYESINNVWWVASAFMGPTETMSRYVLSKLFFEPAARRLQSNVLTWFYASFIYSVGHYLIEMHSGRLQGGARHYRQRVRENLAPATAAPTSATEEPETAPVTIALIGQVDAGKSSLINCLLGDQAAATDILPMTQQVTEYHLGLPDRSERLVLLDTIGYGGVEISDEQKAATFAAVVRADIVLLVMDVNNPARQRDVQILRDLAEWLCKRRHLKPPTIIAVVTHIDMLSPKMEWSPPYNWQSPTGVKERNISEALAYNREVLGSHVIGVLPACTDNAANQPYGIQEWLLPAILVHLPRARAVALLRVLHRDFESGKWSALFEQLWTSGSKIAGATIFGAADSQRLAPSPRPSAPTASPSPK